MRARAQDVSFPQFASFSSFLTVLASSGCGFQLLPPHYQFIRFLSPLPCRSFIIYCHLECTRAVGKGELNSFRNSVKPVFTLSERHSDLPSSSLPSSFILWHVRFRIELRLGLNKNRAPLLPRSGFASSLLRLFAPLVVTSASVLNYWIVTILGWLPVVSIREAFLPHLCSPLSRCQRCCTY